MAGGCSPSDCGAKLADPPAGGFVRNINPAFKKHLFNFPEIEVETAILPNKMVGGIREKPMTLVTYGRCLHSYQLRASGGVNNRKQVNVTAPLEGSLKVLRSAPYDL